MCVTIEPPKNISRSASCASIDLEKLCGITQILSKKFLGISTRSIKNVSSFGQLCLKHNSTIHLYLKKRLTSIKRRGTHFEMTKKKSARLGYTNPICVSYIYLPNHKGCTDYEYNLPSYCLCCFTMIYHSIYICRRLVTQLYYATSL